MQILGQFGKSQMHIDRQPDIPSDPQGGESYRDSSP